MWFVAKDDHTKAHKNQCVCINGKKVAKMVGYGEEMHESDESAMP